MITKSTDKICGIFYYNKDDFDVGIILERLENKITFIDFNIFGEYNGIIIQQQRAIEKICYDDKYLRFMRKIINLNSFEIINIISMEDAINYAIANNRVIAIVTRKQEVEDFNDIKVISFDGVYLKYQIYARWAELYKRIYKIKVSDIVMMQVDSKYIRLIEKIREE